MRNIPVSTSCFAAIWAARLPGEDSENDILERILKVQAAPKEPADRKRVGWADPRFSIELYEGEEIFRVYKGKEYRATATNGYLVLSNGVKCNSLNQLSRAIGTKVENAWNNWYFTGPDGKRELMTHRRK